MARPQKRKQPAAGFSSTRVPFKKTRLSGAGPSRTQDRVLADDPLHGQASSNFPPEFYDNLSRVWLTPRALRELNRRNGNRRQPTPAAARIRRPRDSKARALARLCASAGGPDLSDLRTYQSPMMASSPVSSSSSRRTKSTKATTLSSQTKRSSAYDTNFGQHCEDNGIFPSVYKFPDGSRPPKPANFAEIRRDLKVPRGSLSPSTNPPTAFQDFRDKSATKSEGTVMRTVVPHITGNIDIPNEGHLPFQNLTSITNYTTVNPWPDFFDGAHPGAVAKKVREDLDKTIIPNKKAGVPVAPNFFLEAKGPSGTLEVAELQAMLDGAYGAFIMHALQNYLLDKPVYDGKAYSFSSTLLGGYLTLFAHHLAAPVKSGGRPRCFVTELKAYALRDDDGYLEGMSAFRNLRIKAKEVRDRFIETANSRARRSMEDTDTERDSPRSTVETQPDGSSSPLDFYDCRMFAEPEDDQETQETTVGLAIFDNQNDAQGTQASTGLTTSSMSSSTSSAFAFVFPTCQDEPYTAQGPRLTSYTSPPRIHKNLKVSDHHVNALTAIIKNYNMVGKLAMHLLHSHQPLGKGKIKVESKLETVPGTWMRPTSADSLDPAGLHGLAFKIDHHSGENATLIPYEFARGPSPVKGDEGAQKCMAEMTEYIIQKALVDVLALQIIQGDDPSPTAEIEVESFGTLTLPQSMQRIGTLVPVSWPAARGTTSQLSEPPPGQHWNEATKADGTKTLTRCMLVVSRMKTVFLAKVSSL